jgi:hypothetical protein
MQGVRQVTIDLTCQVAVWPPRDIFGLNLTLGARRQVR